MYIYRFVTNPDVLPSEGWLDDYDGALMQTYGAITDHGTKRRAYTVSPKWVNDRRCVHDGDETLGYVVRMKGTPVKTPVKKDKKCSVPNAQS